MNKEKIPDYRRANNVKYYIEGMSARKWCYLNKVSYSSFYQQLYQGKSIDEIKTRLLQVYQNNGETNSVEDIAAYVRYIYLNTKSVSKVKSWLYNRDLTAHEKDRIWRMVVAGTIAPSDTIEIWKEISEDPQMQVSNYGNFRKKYYGDITYYRYLKPYPKPRYKGNVKTNRVSYMIKIGPKEHSASKVIAEYFIPNPHNWRYTFFLDGDPSNLNYKNIKWISKREYGRITGYLSKSKPVRVREKYARSYKDYRSVRSAAKHLAVSYQTLLDYLDPKTKPKNSVLSGFTIQYI